MIIFKYCKVGDYRDFRFDLTRKISNAFDSNGIEIMFSQPVKK